MCSVRSIKYSHTDGKINCARLRVFSPIVVSQTRRRLSIGQCTSRNESQLSPSSESTYSPEVSHKIAVRELARRCRIRHHGEETDLSSRKSLHGFHHNQTPGVFMPACRLPYGDVVSVCPFHLHFHLIKSISCLLESNIIQLQKRFK